MTPSISLLFLTMNRLGIVARCFRSLAPTLARGDVEWLIVDNASTDGTATWLRALATRYPERVHVLLSAVNTGVAGGRQILLDHARGETLIILDSDVEARRADWLDRLITPLAIPDVWIAGPGGCFVVPDWTDYEAAPRGYVGEVDVCSGYCQAWKHEAFERGVQMDMAYNPRWHEDSDTCLQARALGGRVWNTGDVGLFHLFSHTGDDGTSWDKQRYLASKWRGKGLIRAEREAVTA